MKTDLTRSTFRREKHYSSVRMQQGRVQLDADWNEQLDIEMHTDTSTRLDVIGACGSPEGAPGFEIGVTPDGSDLTISPGRIYVGGTLCELETTPIAIVGATGKNLRLDAIEADGHRLVAGDWVSLAPDGAQPVLAKIDNVDAAKDSVTFAAGGPTNAELKALAQAKNPTLTWVCTYLTQPDFPGPRPKTIGLKAGGYLAYLDVWQQNVTALDDREIRETALGGPDSGTRTRTVWQVELYPAKVSTGEKGPTCKSEPLQFPTPTTGRLRARAEPETTAADPCTVPPGAGFRRLENQLYRVEIHDPGALGKATFKWSRENGSVVVRWLGNKGASVLVDGLGRDDVLGISSGNLVELASILDELARTPGELRTVNGIDISGTNGTTLKLISPPTFPGDVVHPKVRRWEDKDKQTIKAGWTKLEDGVEIDFADGFYNTGDYWLIPARTATGDVEWPNDGGDPTATPPIPPNPLMRPPEGIVHSYCKLAALSFSKTWTVNAVCRPTFPPLTDLPTGGVQEEPGIHVLDIRTRAGRQLRNDTVVHAAELAKGLEIVCDAAIEFGTTHNKPTVLVTLDLPYPLIPEEISFWAKAAHIKEPFGTIPVTLDGTATSKGDQTEWVPSRPAELVVGNVLTTLAKAPWLRKQLLVHLTLKGNFIYAEENPKLNLDGEVFGILDGTTLDAQLPQSGDGRRGGNLDMWFWLVPNTATNGLVVGVLAAAPALETPALRQAAGQVVSLSVDRSKLRAMVPTDIAVDETAQTDLDAARADADAVSLQKFELRAAIDDRLAGAGDLFAQQVGQVGVHLQLDPMPGDAIVQQGAGLAEQGFDIVIAGRDVIDKANDATPGLLPTDDQVEL